MGTAKVVVSARSGRKRLLLKRRNNHTGRLSAIPNIGDTVLAGGPPQKAICLLHLCAFLIDRRPVHLALDLVPGKSALHGQPGIFGHQAVSAECKNRRS